MFLHSGFLFKFGGMDWEIKINVGCIDFGLPPLEIQWCYPCKDRHPVTGEILDYE